MKETCTCSNGHEWETTNGEPASCPLCATTSTQAYPTTADLDDCIADALLSYQRALEAGARPDHAEFLRRHADRAEQLAPLISAGQHADELLTPLQALAGPAKEANAALPRSSADGGEPGETASYRGAAPAGERGLPVGTLLLNRYRVEGVLGQGGMGEVYLARDQALERRVAVKLIRPRNPELLERSIAEPWLREAFIHEARIGANLMHAAIATVFDFGFQGDHPFIVFEYVDGETLSDTLKRRGRLPLDEVRLLLTPLAQALHYAHGREIVHRDLKPLNIRSTAQGLYKILDLGLAREFRQEGNWRFAGTPRYASPEQAAGLPCDGRTDQYALALIAFEMLTGRSVFQAGSVDEYLRLHREQPAPSVREYRPEVPQSVDQALRRALAKDPNERFTSCEELAAALGCQFLTSTAPHADPPEVTAATKMRGIWNSARLKFTRRGHRIHLALSGDFLWVEYREELRRWPLQQVEVQETTNARWLRLLLAGKAQAFRLSNAADGATWSASIRKRGRGSPAAAPGAAAEPTVTAVPPLALLQRQPPVRYQTLGMADCTTNERRLSEAGLKVHALLMGAEAVIDVREERVPGLARTRWRRSGTAVRAADSAGRYELLARWFGEQCRSAADRLLLLLSVLLVLDLGVQLLFFFVVPQEAGVWNVLRQLAFPGSDGRPVPMAMAGRLITFACPFGLACWLRWTQAPQLLRPAATATLLLASAPFLIIPAVAVVTGQLGMLVTLLDPVNLGMVPFALLMCQRCSRSYRTFALASRSAALPAGNRRVLAGIAWSLNVLFAAWILVSVGQLVLTAPGNFVTSVRAPVQADGGRGVPAVMPPVNPALANAVALFKSAEAQLQTNAQQAEHDYRAALAAYRAARLTGPDAEAVRHDIGSCLLNIASLEIVSNRTKEAEIDLRDALAQFDSLSAPWQENPLVRRSRGLAHARMGELLLISNREASGLEHYHKALELLDALADPDSAALLTMAMCRHNIGAGFIRSGDSRSAVTELERALELYERWPQPLGRAPPLVRINVARCRLDLGTAWMGRADFGKARLHLQAAITLLEALRDEIANEPTVPQLLQRARQLLQRASK
jgi:tRNA A-37 threonylcarbamoyl transferase component Bud32/tetratricopeptide (TPR) repeat protein